jgi:DNA mismatch endonuclease (patch repair protein)
VDNLTPEQRRRNMQRICSKNTGPERVLMKQLRRRRIYFACHVKRLPGSPDIVFRRRKVAVFIDSDFFHGRPRRWVKPKTNVEYWSNKIRRNRMKDKVVNFQLEKMGFNVLRFWSSDVMKDPDAAILVLLAAIHYEPRPHKARTT